jgi:membrane protease YdiL (CAAX protease family)
MMFGLVGPYLCNQFCANLLLHIFRHPASVGGESTSLATTTSTTFTLPVRQAQGASRSLVELSLGFAFIMLVLWLPTREQLIVGPLAMLAPLAMVLWRRPGLDQLGLGWPEFLSSLWILPAAVGLAIVSVVLARSAGTLHGLYKADVVHVGGYVLWTIYQQFLLQDYFMPRLTRVLSSDTAIAIAALLFAVAHLPNLPLTIATLVWGGVSCALFRRYRSLYVLGLAQGLLGLCFALCIPDALHHHMRVGLGYWRWDGMQSTR